MCLDRGAYNIADDLPLIPKMACVLVTAGNLGGSRQAKAILMG